MGLILEHTRAPRTTGSAPCVSSARTEVYVLVPRAMNITFFFYSYVVNTDFASIVYTFSGLFPLCFLIISAKALHPARLRLRINNAAERKKVFKRIRETYGILVIQQVSNMSFRERRSR